MTEQPTSACVPLEHPGRVLARIMNARTRRTYGQEMEPMMALPTTGR
jgi:hypothetical protein